MQIFELIPKVMADIGSVAKGRKNEQQKYMFRGIEDMYLAAHPAMVAHGVFCAPEVVQREEYRYDKTNEYGKTTTWLHVAIKVVHRFYAPDGSSVSVTTWGEGLDNSDKATNKAMSGAMKYALIELFSVPTADIEDSDRTTPEAGMKRAGPVITETVTLTPLNTAQAAQGIQQMFAGVGTPAPVKAPEPEPDPFEAEEYITAPQRSYLARRFRECLVPDRQHEAELLRHNALTALELSGLFKSKFIDENGNPTSHLVLVREYEAVGKALMKAARSV